MSVQRSLVGVLVVLVIVAGVGGYFAGSSAVPPPQTITTTVTIGAPSTITSIITSTITEKVTTTVTITSSPTPTPTRTVTPPPATPPPHWPKEIVFRTFSVGSHGYIFGGALASLIEEKLGIKVSVQPGTSSANIQAVANGEVDLALTHSSWIPFVKDPARAALIWGQEVNVSSVSYLLGPIQQNKIFITKQPNLPVNTIKELADYIKGGGAVRIAIGGSPNSLEDFVFRWLMEYYNVTEDVIRRSGGSIIAPGETQAVEALIEGKVDLDFDGCGIPASPYLQLATRMPNVQTIQLTDEDIDIILNKLGFKGAFIVGTVPKETYEFLKDDYRTLLYNIIVIARTDLPSDLIYQITRIAIENWDDFVKAIPAFKVFEPSASWRFSSGLDIHPGASQYYLDRGYIK